MLVITNYRNVETRGRFDPETGDVKIVSGPHKGESGSPGRMALVAMEGARDTVNGWREWRLAEAFTGKGDKGKVSFPAGAPIQSFKLFGVFGMVYRPHNWTGARKGIVATKDKTDKNPVRAVARAIGMRGKALKATVKAGGKTVAHKRAARPAALK